MKPLSGVALVLPIVVAGCMVGPDYQRPDAPVPRAFKELADWRGNRADAGRLAHGLPKSNKFGRGVE